MTPEQFALAQQRRRNMERLEREKKHLVPVVERNLRGIDRARQALADALKRKD